MDARVAARKLTMHVFSLAPRVLARYYMHAPHDLGIASLVITR